MAINRVKNINWKEVFDSFPLTTDDNKQYYNMRSCYRENVGLYFCTGGREIGKSYHMRELASKLWNEYAIKTLWIRNTDQQLKGYPNRFLNMMKSEGFFDDSYIVKGTTIIIKRDSETDPDEKIDEVVVQFGSVNTSYNFRDGEIPDCGLVVFDEFIPATGPYPRDAFNSFIDIISSVLRSRENALVVCIANPVTPFNPYYNGLNILPFNENDITEVTASIEINEDEKVSIPVVIEECGKRYRCNDEVEGERTYMGSLVKFGRGHGAYDNRNHPLKSFIKKQVPRDAKMLSPVIVINKNYYGLYAHNTGLYFEKMSTKPNGIPLCTPNHREQSSNVYAIPKSVLLNLEANMNNSRLYVCNYNDFSTVLHLLFPNEY